ncbi:MAG: efflux RND transporter periplasmic adaptor subunit [Lautropia sp.]
MKKHILGMVVMAAAFGAAGYGLYLTGMHRGMTMATPVVPGSNPAAQAPGAGTDGLAQGTAQGEDATRRHIATGIKAGEVDPVNGRKILYYHDPMVPGNKFDRPAKSPFMDMMLVPVYTQGDSDGGSGGVAVSPRIQQSLGIRTATAVEGSLPRRVAAVGSIAFNERDQVVVQARASGYVERLSVSATLDRVAKGQPLAELYVPEWIAAQEEFLSVRRMQGTALAALVEGARQRMRQVGMSDGQIALVERSGQAQPRMPVIAPIAGVVTELAVREGMAVPSGATLFRINGLTKVWANAEVPESQSSALKVGTKVQATSPALPGARFDGLVQAILPEVSPATRTLKVRLELDNRKASLVPGMLVQMEFTEPGSEKAVLVPTEAIIQTGTRIVVMVAEDDGRFRPVEVEIGAESRDLTEVRRGLEVGQRVVVSSQFLIDSEASLRGVESRLKAAPAGTAAAAGAAGAKPRHSGEATVKAIGQDTVTLSHAPIASLKWGSMVMDFKPPSGGPPRGLAVDDRVSFSFYLDDDGLPQLTALRVRQAVPSATVGKKP